MQCAKDSIFGAHCMAAWPASTADRRQRGGIGVCQDRPRAMLPAALPPTSCSVATQAATSAAEPPAAAHQQPCAPTHLLSRCKVQELLLKMLHACAANAGSALCRMYLTCWLPIWWAAVWGNSNSRTGCNNNRGFNSISSSSSSNNKSSVSFSNSESVNSVGADSTNSRS